MSGWVKLYRKLKENRHANEPEWVALWARILLNATHAKFEAHFCGKMITLQPGQFITGRQKLADETGIHESNIYRLLNCMESEQQISINKRAKGSIITVLNWPRYQGESPPLNSKRTAVEQQLNTKQEERSEEVPPQRDSICNHPPFPAVLAYITDKVNPQQSVIAECFSRDECWRVWLQLEGGKDREGNWYQFSGKRLVGDWRAEFEERLNHNRDRKAKDANSKRNSKGNANADIGTTNEGRASQYKL